MDRWERLFSQLSLHEPAWDDAEVEELADAERAGVKLIDTIAGSLGKQVSITITSGAKVQGRMTAVAETWCVVSDVADVVVRIVAIAQVTGLGAPQPGVRPIPIGVVLRRIAATGATVVADAGAPLTGRIRTVGADYCEIDGVAVPYTALVSMRVPRGVLG